MEKFGKGNFAICFIALIVFSLFAMYIINIPAANADNSGTFTITKSGEATVKKLGNTYAMTLQISGSYEYNEGGRLVIDPSATGTLTIDEETYDLKNIGIKVSRDFTKINIHASIDSEEASRVIVKLFFESPIDFNNPTDSEAKEGKAFMVKIGKVGYKAGKGSTGEIAFS